MLKGIEVSDFYYLATKINEKLIPNEDIRKQDLTEVLLEEIDNKIKAGELCNIQIVGRVATSKSTTAIKLCGIILSKMHKRMNTDNICPDQIEYARKMMSPETKNTCVVIDEYNVMGETGLNATIEAKLYNHFSDIHAQRYVHKILASPTRIFDNNTDIFLETIEVNKKEQTTKLAVYYRIQKPTEPIFQHIGTAEIFVGDIINKDYYKAYRKKKFKRMELLTKEGITDLRQLEDARIIKAVYDRTHRIVNAISLSRGMLENRVNKEARKQKKIFSLLTQTSLIDRVQGLLKQRRDINEIKEKIKNKENTKMNEKKIKELNEAKEMVKEAEKDLQEEINELDKLNKLFDEYQKLKK